MVRCWKHSDNRLEEAQCTVRFKFKEQLLTDERMHFIWQRGQSWKCHSINYCYITSQQQLHNYRMGLPDVAILQILNSHKFVCSLLLPLEFDVYIPYWDVRYCLNSLSYVSPGWGLCCVLPVPLSTQGILGQPLSLSAPGHCCPRLDGAPGAVAASLPGIYISIYTNAYIDLSVHV